MTRWEPNARGRLELAALELYSERGYDQTTVAEIARRAGLTERTFFRHFADKREVLFAGSGPLQERLVRGIGEAPDGLAPIDVVGATFESAAEVFGERSTMAGLRQAVVAANPELRERELIKLAALAAALADALRERGVADPAASLAAEAGVAVFKIAFGRWAGGTDEESLKQVIQDSMAELKTVAAGSRRAVTR
jgi:AcrR family transcriptional regulator